MIRVGSTFRACPPHVWRPRATMFCIHLIDDEGFVVVVVVVFFVMYVAGPARLTPLTRLP